MSVINFTRLVKQYYNRQDSVDARCGGVRDDDFELGMVKLMVKPGTMIWTPLSQPTGSADLSRRVNISYSPASSQDQGVTEAVGQLHLSKESENIIRVTLEKGIVKGLNRTLELPLDDPELIGEFGSYLEIDPSKPVSEVKKNKIMLNMSVERAITGSASAIIRCKAKEYKGEFECIVVMQGKVINQDPEETIGQIVKELKERFRGKDVTDNLAALDLSPSFKEVEFKMAGEVEIHWERELNIEWQT